MPCPPWVRSTDGARPETIKAAPAAAKSAVFKPATRLTAALTVRDVNLPLPPRFTKSTLPGAALPFAAPVELIVNDDGVPPGSWIVAPLTPLSKPTVTALERDAI